MSFPKHNTTPRIPLKQAAATLAEALARPGEERSAANSRARSKIAYAVKIGQLTRTEDKSFDATEFEQWCLVALGPVKGKAIHTVIGSFIPDAGEANMQLAVALLQIKGLRHRLAKYRLIDRKHINALRQARRTKATTEQPAVDEPAQDFTEDAPVDGFSTHTWGPGRSGWDDQ